MNKLFTKENLNIWLLPIFVFILTIILLFINIYTGIIGIAFSVMSGLISYESYINKDKEFKKFAENLDVSFEGFTKTAIFTMPFPIVVMNENKELAWYNSRFKQMVDAKDSLVEEKIYNVIPEIGKDILDNLENGMFNLDYSLKQYEVHKNTSEGNKGKMILLYFIDTTEKNETYAKYLNEKTVVVNIRNDNLEEISQNTPSEKRPILFAEIDSTITSYFQNRGALIKKLESGRYIATMFKKSLDEMVEDKFSFVEKIRNLSESLTIPPTLSIGIGFNEDSPRDNEKESQAALDIALGRGGDQIVIKSNDKLDYFGGKNQATEKRTKVKARVFAHALSQYISKSSEIIISGHINPDMDSFGSAVGIWHSVMKLNKPAYIVLSNVTPAIKNIYEYSIKNIENLESHILTPQEAFDMAKASSVLLITDNHRKNSIEEPRLFEKTSQVVVIDHHRRGSDYIENTILSYEEPSASSASELVTEMLMYMHEKVQINKYVADGLLAGIMTDTKNFNQQTGLRTFEAAAVLKQNGADTTVVKKLFSDDLDTIRIKSEIISNSEIYKEKYIFGRFDGEVQGASLIASLAADELTSIQNIEASFVLVKQDNKVHISARSLGDVSVQLIMEKLSGGGHRTMAATQLEVSVDEAIDLLKKAISEYNEEETKWK